MRKVIVYSHDALRAKKVAGALDDSGFGNVRHTSDLGVVGQDVAKEYDKRRPVRLIYADTGSSRISEVRAIAAISGAELVPFDSLDTIEPYGEMRKAA